jgi:HEAT repeat protein
VIVKLGLTYGPKNGTPDPGQRSPADLVDPISPIQEAIRLLELLQPERDEQTRAHMPARVEIPVPEDVPGAVTYWLSRNSRNPSDTARKISELAAIAPEEVVDTVILLYETGCWGEAAPFLARLLNGQARTLDTLCELSTPLEAAIHVAQALARYDMRFDARLARKLLDDDRLTDANRQRGLAVLGKLASGGRLVPILIQFLRDPDTRIRSKAALIFGQIMAGQGIMERLIKDTDARVRANFVEGLWNCLEVDCRPLFRHALNDPDPRVVSNALVGLHRLRETPDFVRHVGKMARRSEARFRASAAWVLGQTGEQIYADVLRQLFRDQDPQVRRNALRSLRRINLANASNES